MIKDKSIALKYLEKNVDLRDILDDSLKSDDDINLKLAQNGHCCWYSMILYKQFYSTNPMLCFATHKTMSGRKFNDLFGHIQLYKVTPKNYNGVGFNGGYTKFTCVLRKWEPEYLEEHTIYRVKIPDDATINFLDAVSAFTDKIILSSIL